MLQMSATNGPRPARTPEDDTEPLVRPAPAPKNRRRSPAPPKTWLKVLARKRFPTHRVFSRGFDEAVRGIDPTLVGTCPCEKTVYRWMNGDRVPFPRHQLVLEAMFPGWSCERLLSTPDLTPVTGPEVIDLDAAPAAQRANVQAACGHCGNVTAVVVELVATVEP